MTELLTYEMNFASHWRLTKMEFSKALPKVERLSELRAARSEPASWQQRYWEYLIRDDADMQAHMGYLNLIQLSMVWSEA